jgi:hypothetical protein
MYSIRATLVVALLFLAVALIFGSYGRSDVFAKSKVTRSPIECDNLANDNDVIRCCQTETDSKGIAIKYCTFCDNTAPPSNCTPRTQVSEIKLPTSDLPTVEQTPPKVLSGKNLSSLSTSTIEEQPSTTLQQQKTTTCPDGSTPDDKGNCPTAENKTPPPPSSDNKQLKGESESEKNINNDNNDNNNNHPNSDHNHKGNELGKTKGGSETKKTDAGSDSN